MSTPLAPGTPAAWYPDPADPTIQRYWDGTAWTDHTAPAAGAATPAAAAPAGGNWWSKQSKAVQITLIVVAAIVALGIIGGIGNALGGGRSDRTAQDKPAVVDTPKATPTVKEEEPEPEPVVDEAPKPDATFVITSAHRDLDDYAKDIDDMVRTLDENGFWRLLTNYGELSFNVGQLQGLDVTSNIKAEWDAALIVLDDLTTKIGDDIGNRQYDTLRADLAAAKSQTQVLKDIASRAVTDQ